MYILISVCENSIMVDDFKTLEGAQLQMMKEFCNAANVDLQDCSNPEWYDDECSYSEREAEVYDGTNHDNYAWKIVELNDDGSIHRELVHRYIPDEFVDNM